MKTNITNTNIKTKEKFYRGGCFHTRAEEVCHMEMLRSEGFSNAEIAEKIGRTYPVVLNAIGCQPKSMTKKNCAFGQKLFAQKNAHRKLYAGNEEINAYNKKVEEYNQKKAELDALKQEIDSNTKRIRKISKKLIKHPDMSAMVVPVATLQ